jgi:dephospho-CoA kinase
MDRLIIGLTGLIGSGKTMASEIFQKLGAYIIDTDLIAKDLTIKNGSAIPILRQYLGGEYFNLDGSLNRLKVRELIFNNKVKKHHLEMILHPMIFNKVLSYLDRCGIIIIVVPLLFQSSRYLQLINRSLFIDVSEDILLNRVVSRDNISHDLFYKILNSQTPRLEQLRLADDIIRNNGSMADFNQSIVTCFNMYIDILGSK